VGISRGRCGRVELILDSAGEFAVYDEAMSRSGLLDQVYSLRRRCRRRATRSNRPPEVPRRDPPRPCRPEGRGSAPYPLPHWREMVTEGVIPRAGEGLNNNTWRQCRQNARRLRRDCAYNRTTLWVGSVAPAFAGYRFRRSTQSANSSSISRAQASPHRPGSRRRATCGPVRPDQRRTALLEGEVGASFVLGHEVLTNTEGVIEVICQALQET